MPLFGKKLTEKETAQRNWFRDQGEQSLRFHYPLSADSLVVDAGGYKGSWATEIYARYGCTILVFEPVPDYADLLRKRFATNPRIQVYEVALGGSDSFSEIYVSDGGASFFPQDGDTVPVQVVDASEFLEDLDVTRIDLMKINVEGGEYDLLPNLMRSGYANLTTDIQVRFHDFVPDAEARADLIRTSLSKTHSLTWQYPFVWENWHRL